MKTIPQALRANIYEYFSLMELIHIASRLSTSERAFLSIAKLTSNLKLKINFDKMEGV